MVSCTGRSCALSGAESSDSDGTIVSYAWRFGDGTAATGANAQHTYATTGNYTIELTVTDDDGATATATKSIELIHLTANVRKVKRVQQVVLAWNGASGASFDVLRNGLTIVTTAGRTYTDALDRGGPRSYSYKVCETAGSICSDTATVGF
jgi:vibriolysin